jgi:hypothetical protein
MAAHGWTRPADLVAQLQRLWDRGELLSEAAAGEARYPLRLRLKGPSPRDLGQRFAEVREWVRELEEGARAARGFGYEVEFATVANRQLGSNQVPERVVVPTEADALRLVGATRAAERYRALKKSIVAAFPELEAWVVKRPLKVIELGEAWSRLLAVVRWFVDHPSSGLYLRQLDIEGVDTKFIESQRGVLAELLDRVLAAEPASQSPSGRPSLEQRFGLKGKPPLVRFRVLDPALFIQGLSDLTVTAADFARLDLKADTVFVTENEVNGLAFPPHARSVVVFGQGYAVDRLAEVRWLATRRLLYWGDLDTHGFGILNRLRHAFPGLTSILMDRETLLAHRALWVEEAEPHLGALEKLTPAEAALFRELQCDALGHHVRLEQERIAFGWVQRALAQV